jgi:hypothetical protein
MPEEDLHLSDPVRSRAYGAPASCRPGCVSGGTRATHEHNRLGGAIPARGVGWFVLARDSGELALPRW